MTCVRFHFDFSKDACLKYQKYWDKAFPACHPCNGCAKRAGEKKRPVALSMRQGGRHKEGGPLSPEERAARNRKSALDHYYANKTAADRPPRIIVKEKECRTCQTVKPASDFYPQKACRDGLKSECKRCDNQKRSMRPRRLQVDEGI